MKALIFPQPTAPYSTTRYLQKAFRQLGIEVLDPDNRVGDGVDILATMLVQPTAAPGASKYPLVTLFNDRLSRMPAAWVAPFLEHSVATLSVNLPEPFPWSTVPFGVTWAPGAYDPVIHALPPTPDPHEGDRLGVQGIGYLGTFNAWRKYRFLKTLSDKLGVVIFGNAWDCAPGDIQMAVAGPPAYGGDYARMLSRFSIVVNVAESRWGPNRKTFEIPHQALMLTERVPGTVEVFHGLEDRPWWFSTPRGLVQAARYYVDNPREINVHRREQVTKVAPYTYEAQAKTVLRALEGGIPP